LSRRFFLQQDHSLSVCRVGLVFFFLLPDSRWLNNGLLRFTILVRGALAAFFAVFPRPTLRPPRAMRTFTIPPRYSFDSSFGPIIFPPASLVRLNRRPLRGLIGEFRLCPLDIFPLEIRAFAAQEPPRYALFPTVKTAIGSFGRNSFLVRHFFRSSWLIPHPHTPSFPRK